MSIHPTAFVHPRASLGENVTVGPFSVIEEGARIGDRCIIEAGAQIRKNVSLGEECEIGGASILGGDPQFRGFDKSINSGVIIGSQNVFREHCTVHRSIYADESTTIGSENYFMAGGHVGHDCIVGDHNTLANGVLLGGHVLFGNHIFVGGGSMFHQFVRVGDYVMCQGLSGISLDLPPYVICSEINRIAGLNVIGLKRAGFSSEERAAIKVAYKQVYRSSDTLSAVLKSADAGNNIAPVEKFFDFLRQPSKKGCCIRTRK